MLNGMTIQGEMDEASIRQGARETVEIIGGEANVSLLNLSVPGCILRDLEPWVG